MSTIVQGIFDYARGRTREVELVAPPTALVIRPAVEYDLEFPYPPDAPPASLMYSERVFRLHKTKRGTFYYREEPKRHRSLEAMPRCDNCMEGPKTMFYLPDVPENESSYESSRRVCPACYASLVASGLQRP